MSKTTQAIGLVVLLAICLGVGFLGSLATISEIPGWFRTLAKPTWNPPDYVFGPVWTALYVMMAVAAWLVWRQRGFAAARLPLMLFGIQLGINLAWSFVFFAWHQPGWAFVDIVMLWLALAATVVAFFRRSHLAGWLLVPYLGWVTFASVLNLAIWRLNTP